MRKHCAILLFPLLSALAEEGRSDLSAVTSTAPAQTSENAEVHDVLRTTPLVVLNSQGGSQNDLSIRGSSFNGAGLSLGGLTLRNPQTEHFNTELPLPAGMLTRPVVMTGLANQGGHLVGTVGFDLLPITGKKQIEVGLGTDSRDRQNLLIQQKLSDSLGLSIFAGRESANGVDYPDNDLDRETLGSHLQFREENTQVDLIISHQKKEFGARGYYGVSDRFPATENTEDTLLFLSAIKGTLPADYLRAGTAWREFIDDYRLPSLNVHNQHRSRTASAFFDGRTLEINGWALGWRADADEESVSSSGSTRLRHTRGGLSLLPQWRGDRLKITAGARGEFFSDESSEFLPQLGMDYLLSDNLTAFASYSKSVRHPSYTEHYGFSPANTGSTALKPQTAAQTEIGLNGVPSESMDWKIAAFHRRSENTVDWIQQTNRSRWTATDIGTLNTSGIEMQLGWYPAKNLEVQCAYTWLHKNEEAPDLNSYASRYALDYPEHLAQLSLLWRPLNALEFGTVQTLRKQTDNAARTSTDFGADSAFIARWTPQQAPFATVSLRLNNAWDNDFQTVPGQRPPQRFAEISLTVNF